MNFLKTNIQLFFSEVHKCTGTNDSGNKDAPNEESDTFTTNTYPLLWTKLEASEIYSPNCSFASDAPYLRSHESEFSSDVIFEKSSNDLMITHDLLQPVMKSTEENQATHTNWQEIRGSEETWRNNQYILLMFPKVS